MVLTDFAPPRLLWAGAFLVALASPTFAHAKLVESAPAADSMVKPAPTTLAFRFSEAVDPAFTGASLTGPGDGAAMTGPAQVEGTDATAVAIPITGALAPGLYTVAWRAVATDGHKTTGSFVFTVSP